MLVFNDDEYILYNSKNKKFFDVRKQSDFHLSKYFPNDYEKILTSNLVATDKYFSKKFNLPITYGFNIVFQLKEKYIQEQQNEAQTQYFLVSVTILVFSIILTFLIIKLFKKNILNIRELEILNQRLNSASKISKIGFWESKPNSDFIQWSK